MHGCPENHGVGQNRSDRLLVIAMRVAGLEVFMLIHVGEVIDSFWLRPGSTSRPIHPLPTPLSCALLGPSVVGCWSCGRVFNPAEHTFT